MMMVVGKILSHKLFRIIAQRSKHSSRIRFNQELQGIVVIFGIK